VKGSLNHQNFVIDFFEIKSKLIAILDELDHAVLLPELSEEIKIHKTPSQIMVDFNEKHYEFPQTDVKMLPLRATTAELLAEYIHNRLKIVIGNVPLKVEVGESEGAIAIYEE
jgi:6-pyruvoyl-tetrahydropterin synthase